MKTKGVKKEGEKKKSRQDRGKGWKWVGEKGTRKNKVNIGGLYYIRRIRIDQSNNKNIIIINDIAHSIIIDYWLLNYIYN